MTTSLFANDMPGLLRLARMSGDRIAGISFHRENDPMCPGALVMANVVQVHAGMQAAFCEIPRRRDSSSEEIPFLFWVTK